MMAGLLAHLLALVLFVTIGAVRPVFARDCDALALIGGDMRLAGLL